MDYDVITVGGGLAGASLAKALAERGVRVLVLERETVFRDRVRGEQMHCWGVAEACALGLCELLKETCGCEVRYWSTQMAGVPETPPRDLVETTPHRSGALNFYHPEMQAALLQAAEDAGATVRRGVTVTQVRTGKPATVQAREAEHEHTYEAPLVVGADGRNSGCRKWAGFQVQRDPDRMVIAGVLCRGMPLSEDRVRLFINPDRGLVSLAVPLGKERFRCYAGQYEQEERLLHGGDGAMRDFIAASVTAGSSAEWFENIEVAGPLAAFQGADSWVEHPYHDGVALIGDAAASTDPSYGCGLSLTLRDVRVLRDQILSGADWDTAAHAYAEEHDGYYGALHRLLDWMTKMFYEPTPEAQARRARALPRIAGEPERVPDVVGLGPDFPSDEEARRRFFGED